MFREHSDKLAMHERDLIFIHIPKAAGTTLHEVIARQFPRDAVFTIDGAKVRECINEFKNLPEEERRTIRCLKGHMPFGLHRYLSRPVDYITLVRHPVDRVISHYYYVLRQPDHYLHHEVTSRRMSLREYVSSGVSPELSNGQTRLISGVPELDSVTGGVAVSADVLETAKANLQDHFAAVGLSDRFDESLVLFKRLLGWGNICYVRRNVTRDRPSKEEIPGETIRVIERFNEFDLQLYGFAEQSFEDMIAGQGSSFRNELRAFNLLNNAYWIAWKADNLRSRGMRKAKVAARNLLSMSERWIPSRLPTATRDSDSETGE
jgi:hypothetical protein